MTRETFIVFQQYSTVTTWPLFHKDGKNDGLIPKPPMHDTVHFILVARIESIIVMS